MSDSEKNTSQPKNSSELEHEVETTRANLTATLDEIKERLSPTNIADQVFDLTMINGGSEFAISLGQSVRANPVPTLLIGAGLAWILASASNGRPEEDANMTITDRRSKLRPSAVEQTGEAADKAGRISSGSAEDYEGSTLPRVYGDAEHLFENSRQGVETMFEKQPLVLGALGLAIGAAIGAALPTTHAENRWMGERSDELKRRAREITEEKYDSAREVARQIYDDVRDEVESERLADIPGEIVAQVTERVRTAAEGASSSAKEMPTKPSAR